MTAAHSLVDGLQLCRCHAVHDFSLSAMLSDFYLIGARRQVAGRAGLKPEEAMVIGTCATGRMTSVVIHSQPPTLVGRRPRSDVTRWLLNALTCSLHTRSRSF